MEFDESSISITNLLDKKTKKENGIFFTPYSIIEKTYDIINPIIEAQLLMKKIIINYYFYY